jgi:hypothetical protein
MNKRDYKAMNEELNQPSCLGAVRQRISLLPNHKMSDKMFDKKANELAKIMVETMGCEIINKMKYFAPLRGDYWQFQYVA